MAKSPTTASKTTAVAKATSTAMAEVPEHLRDMMDADAGKGVSTNAADVGIPFLYILQDLSPQVKKRDDAYVEGAEVGMIINNLSKTIYDGNDGILFVPCFFKSVLVEWIPRDKGGGYVGEYPMDHPIRGSAVKTDRKKAPKLPNGNDLVETKYYYGFFVKDEGGVEPAVIGLASSGLKVSREWQRLFGLVKTKGGDVGPSFSKAYRMRSKLTKNAQNEWFTWSITAERWVDSTEYQLARKFEEQCAMGEVKTSQLDSGAQGGDLAAGEEEVL